MQVTAGLFALTESSQVSQLVVLKVCSSAGEAEPEWATLKFFGFILDTYTVSQNVCPTPP